MKPYLCFARSVALSISIIVLSACSSESTTDQAVENSILFEPCEDASGLDCGVFEAPLIHDSTDNRKISIDVARLTGTGEGPHETLLFIEGGPGPGTDVLREFALADIFPPEIRESYHIVGFDHRGVDNPLQIDCDQLGDAESIQYPRDQRDIMTVVTDFTMLADSCSARYADQLQWVGSNAMVQDIEVMRSMLNAPKLNIIATSFGTRIAALYLDRFPAASGRIILDAPLPIDGKLDTLLPETAAAQQASFELMLEACGTTLPECDRAGIEAAFIARANTLLNDGDLVTFKAFFKLLSNFAIEESENGEFLAPLLIDYAVDGDPTNMLALIQDLGLESGGDEADGLTLERAVTCADDAARPGIESLITTLGSLNESSDLFAEALLPLAASCVGWPEALQPVTDISTTNAPASLVIGGIGDVRTPINLAVETAAAIGGVFISSDHQGHGTVFIRENDCIDSIVIDFLLEGTLPPEGTSCS